MLPVFLFLAAVVIDGARTFDDRVSLEGGAREGALYASQNRSHTDTAGITARVMDELEGLDLPAGTDIAVSVTCSLGGVSPYVSCLPSVTYTNVKVTVSYDIDMSGQLGDFWPSSWPISATSTARIIPAPAP